MRSELAQVGCASLPLAALAALGDLRRAEGISVTVAEDRAWVRWEPGDESVLRRVMPLPGAELYTRRGLHWYKLGARLPSFGLPMDQPGLESRPLHRAVVPRAVWPEPPGDVTVIAVELALVRDDHIRTATALRCPVNVLGQWADIAPSSRFNGLLASRSRSVVLIVGSSLPEVAGPGVERFWGARVLTPLGLRAEPSLPEQALRGVLGIGDDQLALLSADGVEIIPYAALRPLSRAGVRLAVALSGGSSPGDVDP